VITVLGRLAGGVGTLARTSALVLFVQLAGAGLLFGQQLVLARWMGITEYGTYAVVLAWAALLAVLIAAGMPTAALRYAAAYRAVGDLSRLAGISRFARRLIIGLGTAAFVASVAGLATGMVAPEVGLLAAAAIALATLTALGQLCLELARTLGLAVLAYVPVLILRPIAVVAAGGVALVLAGLLDAPTAVAATLVGVAVVLVAQTIAIDRRLGMIVGEAPARFEPGTWLRVAAPLLVINLCWTALPSFGTLALGAVRGPEAAALFTVAWRTAALSSFGLLAVNTLVTPTYAALHATGDKEQMRLLAIRASHLIFWPSLVLGVAIIVFADPIMRAVGEGFEEARLPLLILVIGQLVNAASGTVNGIMVMTGHQSASATIFVVMTVVAAVLDVVGAVIAGVVGAAIATSISVAILNLWLLALVLRRVQVDPSIMAGISDLLGRDRRVGGAGSARR
jgi:O-antigen/teichoic acid export membrane protein